MIKVLGKAAAVGMLLGCLGGCVSLGQVMESKEMMAVCSGADVVTTGTALSKGAVEANPLARLLMKPLGFIGYAGMMIGLTWWLWERDRGLDNIVVGGVRCAAVASNLKLL